MVGGKKTTHTPTHQLATDPGGGGRGVDGGGHMLGRWGEGSGLDFGNLFGGKGEGRRQHTLWRVGVRGRSCTALMEASIPARASLSCEIVGGIRGKKKGPSLVAFDQRCQGCQPPPPAGLWGPRWRHGGGGWVL